MYHKRTLTPSIVVLMAITFHTQAQQQRPTTLAGRSAVYAPHGAIATSQPLASAAGLAVLQNGGNAVDAAVTAAAVLNLVEPHMTGMGGDLFAILWSAKEQRLVGLNASGRAGSLMTQEERQRRSQLNPKRAAERPDPGPAWTSSETIYLSAADQYGNMISFINSLFDAFGSGVVVPGTGFALQNRGAGFTMEPGHPNTIAPAKRPLHTIIPAFVTRPARRQGQPSEGSPPEEPWLSFGVMGGAMQPQGHVQVLLNLLVFDMDLQEAIDAPRFRHLSGRRVALEAPIGDAVRSALTALGHEIAEDRSVAFGGAQAVMRLERGWLAGSDPRKDGLAVGH